MKKLLLIISILIAFIGCLFSQKRTVCGYVTDTLGNPISDILVYSELNNLNKTLTDSLGFFSINGYLSEKIYLMYSISEHKTIIVTLQNSKMPNFSNDSCPTVKDAVVFQDKEYYGSNPFYIVDDKYICFDFESKTDYSSNIEPIEVNSTRTITGIEATKEFGRPAKYGAVIVYLDIDKKLTVKTTFKTSISVSKPSQLPKLQNKYLQNADNLSFSWGEIDNQPKYNQYDFFNTGLNFENTLSLNAKKQLLETDFEYKNTTGSGVIPNSKNNENQIEFEMKREEVKILNFNLNLNYLNSNSDFNSLYSMPMYGLLLTPSTFNNQDYFVNDTTQNSFDNGITDNPYWTVNKDLQSENQHILTSETTIRYNLNPLLSIINEANFSFDKKNFETGNNVDYSNDFDGSFSEKTDKYTEFVNNLSLQLKTIERKKTTLTFLLDYKYSSYQIISEYFNGINFINPNIFNQINCSLKTNSSLNYNRYINTFGSELNLEIDEILDFQTLFYSGFSSTYKSKSLLNFHASIVFTPTRIKIFEDILGFDISFFSSIDNYSSEVALNFKNQYFYDDNFHLNIKKINLQNSLIPENKCNYSLGGIVSFYYNFSVLYNYYSSKTSNYVDMTFNSKNEILIRNIGAVQLKSHYLQFEVWYPFKLFIEFSTPVKKVLSTPNNEIIFLSGFENQIYSAVIPGENYGVFYGTRYKRNNNGDIIIGNDGFPIVDENLGIIGDPNPDWIVDIENSFEIGRHFEFEYEIEIKKGGEIWNGTKNTLNYYGVSQETADLRETKDYVFEGVKEDGTQNDIPVDFFNSQLDLTENYWVRYGEFGVAEDAIEDASWIKLNNLALGYYWKFKKKKIKEITFSIFGENLLILTRYSGLNPDFDQTSSVVNYGLDYFSMPNLRNYGLSLKIEF